MRRRERAQGKFGDQRTTERKDLLRQSAILLRIEDVYACTKNSDRLAFRCDRTAVGGGVNATRHSAEDGESMRNQIDRQTLTNP